MGYAYYERDGMERGYGVRDTCHFDGCKEKINRGLSYLCYSCTLYFCPKHLLMAWKPDGDTVIEFDCFAGQSSQCCHKCAEQAEAEASEEAHINGAGGGAQLERERATALSDRSR